MKYEEALKATVTAEQAENEVEKHGFSFHKFAADYGWKPTYKGKDVLDWLGY